MKADILYILKLCIHSKEFLFTKYGVLRVLPKRFQRKKIKILQDYRKSNQHMQPPIPNPLRKSKNNILCTEKKMAALR